MTLLIVFVIPTNVYCVELYTMKLKFALFCNVKAKNTPVCGKYIRKPKFHRTGNIFSLQAYYGSRLGLCEEHECIRAQVELLGIADTILPTYQHGVHVGVFFTKEKSSLYSK